MKSKNLNTKKSQKTVPGGLSSSESLFKMSDILARFSRQAGFMFARLQRNIRFIRTILEETGKLSSCL